jgi:ribosomal protein S27AE
MSKVKGNKELEAWTQSKITKAADYLNSVADYMSEEDKKIDMTNKTCTKCHKGKYHETSQHDDMYGVLHCTKCGTQVKRWKVVKEDLDEEQLDEARIKLVKARIRGGKIERRKRVSNIPGMTLRGGQLKRMSAAERRRRKLGQRKGKLKRKAKMARTLMKRQRSLRRRKSLGI